MKKIITTLALKTLIIGHEGLTSDESNSLEASVDYQVSTDQRIEEIVTDLLDFFPEGTKVNLKSSPMEGLYAVHIGSQVFYISDDGRFLLSGDIYNTQTSENLTDNDNLGFWLAFDQNGDNAADSYLDPGVGFYIISVQNIEDAFFALENLDNIIITKLSRILRGYR